MLGRFNEDLTALQRMIRRGDGDGLFALFTRTRAIRMGIVALRVRTPPRRTLAAMRARRTSRLREGAGGARRRRRTATCGCSGTGR